MKLLSVQVGKPRTIESRGRPVRTGIFKDPVLFRVRATRLGLEGDVQADRRVHGGPEMAVYAYDLSGYAHWREELGAGFLFGHGTFGENLTVDGMPETEVRIDDVYRIGAALLQVSKPRSPCFKLALRMERPDFPKRFLRSRRTGFYLRVLEEGELGAGDPITLVSREPDAASVAETVRESFGV
jgi:MOSC domain-containing protein YiiM